MANFKGSKLKHATYKHPMYLLVNNYFSHSFIIKHLYLLDKSFFSHPWRKCATLTPAIKYRSKVSLTTYIYIVLNTASIIFTLNIKCVEIPLTLAQTRPNNLSLGVRRLQKLITLPFNG